MTYTQRYCSYTEIGVPVELARRAAWALTCKDKGLALSDEQLADINEADLYIWRSFQ